jgi:hypothetical protein
VRLQPGPWKLPVIGSMHHSHRALRDLADANFATRPKLLGGDILLYGWSDIVFSPSGEYWRKLQQLCAAEILGPKRVLTFRHIREQEVRTYVRCVVCAILFLSYSQ